MNSLNPSVLARLRYGSSSANGVFASMVTSTAGTAECRLELPSASSYIPSHPLMAAASAPGRADWRRSDCFTRKGDSRWLRGRRPQSEQLVDASIAANANFSVKVSSPRGQVSTICENFRNTPTTAQSTFANPSSGEPHSRTRCDARTGTRVLGTEGRAKIAANRGLRKFDLVAVVARLTLGSGNLTRYLRPDRGLLCS